MKIRPVGAELFHAGKQTDGKTGGGTDGQAWEEAKCRFSHFANTPKTVCSCYTVHIFILYESQNKQPLYNINWLIFITAKDCVYCTVRTKSLSVIQINL